MLKIIIIFWSKVMQRLNSEFIGTHIIPSLVSYGMYLDGILRGYDCDIMFFGGRLFWEVSVIF